MTANFRKNNEGSTFLLVMVIVVFVAAIGVITLGIASDYLVTVLVDRNSTDHFYGTERIITEVKTGLQEYAADCSKNAYETILENYKDTDGETRKDIFSRSYLKTLSVKLGAMGASSWSGTEDKEYSCNIDAIKKLTTKPDAVASVPGTDLIIALQNESGNYSLTLQNVLIEYENESGYRSTVRTDIVVRVPDYHFDGDSTFNELKKYIVIADDALVVRNTSGSGHAPSAQGATFTGNIYTGNREDSIQIDQQAKAVFNSDMIISRGNFNVLTGSDVNIRANDGSSLSNLWISNFRISPNGVTNTSLYSDVTIHANSYIENDFIINDDYSRVELGGSYYGYSYNEDNSASAPVINADYSSAFLINGVNTTLRTPNLNKLILAGRAFISRHNSSGMKLPISDIMMGESLAIKSNQIAYLVPNKFITVDHNPVLSTEDGANVLKRAELLASDIGEFLDSSEPVIKNYISSTGGFNVVYYFLNFKDAVNANKYFSSFYSSNENANDVASRARTYISTTDSSGMKLDASLYLLAGNIIHNYYASTGPKFQSSNYYDSSGVPKEDLLNDGILKGKEYVGRQLTLLPDATDTSTTMRLPADAGGLVASKIIDFSKVTSHYQKYFPDLSANLVVSSGDYVLDNSSPDRGIIICKGNVIAQRTHFEGLIIAGGSVTVNVQGVNLSYNQLLVKSLLKEISADEELKKYFLDIDSFEGMDTSISLSDYVSFKNWAKDED